ncbi:hypothetical protein BDV96DRAFT_563399 [Lophiotrema nucula]|uniref:Pentacotripeptide-repeat region of PRORP domain-containing protein n=1 Tax=Lophiotrema nucula TaxID=690887 RepID=A0A6A5ZTI0_9PLEO|nr:hypothetical protein BDV96DRAFT_563399 [Lophiotrema nucula]
MLERTATCLESGGRQLLQARKRALRSRRMLHSSFWHHGASDLNLPIWWASAFLPDCAVGDIEDPARSGPHATGAARQNGVLLDFLYPERTLAFLQRLSNIGRDAVDTRRTTRAHTGSIRQFSTTRNRVQKTNTAFSTSTVDQEVEERLRGSTAIDALGELMIAEEKAKEELAWRLYKTIPESHRSPALQVDFLDYLGSPTKPAHATPIIRVFDTVPIEERRSSSYRIAISAYLMLDMVGPAVRLHEEAASHAISGDFGTGLVLARTVQDSRWDLVIRVYEAFHKLSQEESGNRTPQTQRNEQSPLATLWKRVDNISDVKEKWFKFLRHMRQFRHELQLATREGNASRNLSVELFEATCKHVLATKTPDEDVIREFFQDTFRDLRDLDLRMTTFYRIALFEMHAISRYREYSSQPNIFIELYRQFRERAIKNPLPLNKPGKTILLALLAIHIKHGDAESVDNVLGDWRRFYPNQPGYDRVLTRLMAFHAEHGRVDQVEQLFEEYRSYSTNKVDLYILSRLLFVHARRVDVAATIQHFRRISEEFGLTPDRKCWNILLLVYARADDLDGAMGCLNDFLQTGITPDNFTFGPLLDLCAGRGDIEAFETLYSKAEQFKIPIRNEAVIRTGYVEVFLNASDPEGAHAIAHRMLQEHRVGTLQGSLSVAWNMLIAYHALKGDIRTSRQLYNEMIENAIPVTSWTYGALMRALIEIGQTNAAFKILRRTMPDNNVRVHAFHYALVMTGFLREHQYWLATRAYNHMVRLNVSQTPNSRLKALEVLGREELQALEASGEPRQVSRLKGVEDVMRELLLGDAKSEMAHREPRHNVFVESRRHNAPESYFGLLISLYSSQGAYHICKEMFETALSMGSDDPDYEPPMSLVTALMEAHLQAGEHAEVDKCWELVHSQADNLVKTFEQINTTQPPSIEFDSIMDPAVKEAHSSSKVAPNRRQILVKPARIYIRSLLRRPDTNGLQHAQRTFRKMLMYGYVLDAVTWNDFIQMLCLRGRTLDAFTTCEGYLMPGFPGWRYISPHFHRHDRPGYTFMEIRHWDVVPEALIPKYKTLVILAGAYARIRRNEDEGRGHDPELGGWAREVLMQMTPMTMRAIETMPRVADGVQEQFIEDL